MMQLSELSPPVPVPRRPRHAWAKAAGTCVRPWQAASWGHISLASKPMNRPALGYAHHPSHQRPCPTRQEFTAQTVRLWVPFDESWKTLKTLNPRSSGSVRSANRSLGKGRVSLSCGASRCLRRTPLKGSVDSVTRVVNQISICMITHTHNPN